MSEFTEHKKVRVEKLETLFYGIVKGEKLGELVRENQLVIESCIPSDVISVVDKLVGSEIPMEDLKRGINKLLNLLHKTLMNHLYHSPSKESYLGCLVENSRILDEVLQEIRPLIRSLNQNPEDDKIGKLLLAKFTRVDKYKTYYVVKENVLFPLIEKHIPEFRCLSVMWSFHDDIKRNLKEILVQLNNENLFDLKSFNRLVGDLFFNIYAIKFREERILYPLVEELIPESELHALFSESAEIGLPFYFPKFEKTGEQINTSSDSENVDLETGKLSVEQIKLLFNHLPVDITFVDENNKVKYFSTPKKRIFPRTKSVIGRDVHNCHPPESVHVVEQIVESFKAGKKDIASFWINMKGERLLIQYFAIRDENGNYKGVVEVSQEITEIQGLQGEKRLLDWNES